MRRKHTEIIGSINQEKSILEKKIDELRTFEREYCTRSRPTCNHSSESSTGTDPPHQQTRYAPRRTWWLPGPARPAKPAVDAQARSRRRGKENRGPRRYARNNCLTNALFSGRASGSDRAATSVLITVAC